MGKDATVCAVPAEALARAPDENILHNCPLCKETFEWVEFQAHAQACIAAHPKLVRQIQEK